MHPRTKASVNQHPAPREKSELLRLFLLSSNVSDIILCFLSFSPFDFIATFSITFYEGNGRTNRSY